MPNQADGQAVRSWATLIAGTDGTNGQTIKTDTDGELQIDVLSIIPGTGATSLGKAEDAAHTSGDVGVMALGVINASGATSFAADGDYAPASLDVRGNARVTGSRLHDAALDSSVQAPVLAGGYASTATPSAVSADGDAVWAWFDRNGRIVSTLGTLIAGEDQTNNRLMTMPSYSYTHITADAAVKSGAGVLHTVTISSDATATAGTIVIYDNTAESGTVIASITVTAAYYTPVTLTFDAAFATGLYVGFTTTADVDVTVTYK